MQVEMSLTEWLDLDAILCEFEVETETYEREPYSWGQSRGMETEVKRVKLEGMHLGDLHCNRYMAVQIFGENAIVGLEERATKFAQEE